MKDKISMKIYNTLAELNQKMEELIKTAENELIKSITGYEFYIKDFAVFLKFKWCYLLFLKDLIAKKVDKTTVRYSKT
ncbi:hypothetical protein INQ45_13705 [Flavobacterium columnare]|uniref:hypothetical protein n=1 Tax=Flavobacterium columnare TaxID=996 RepID=UPI002D214BEB|nr:hypothetical protein [Flavobacterium columnare]MEB3802071.1 hypothetical protein [Flavobacterium columnare]